MTPEIAILEYLLYHGTRCVLKEWAKRCKYGADAFQSKKLEHICMNLHHEEGSSVEALRMIERKCKTFTTEQFVYLITVPILPTTGT